jgi:D-glycero-alpha-D-manno-heptose-7-phosphate kinase
MDVEYLNRPLRMINSVAPIRICDNGGWTDTWFAGHGKVFNIAVSPMAEVQIQIHPSRDDKRVVIHAENYGQRYVRHLKKPTWDHHPLLEATIEHMGVPDDVAIHVTIFSEAPAGASTGTSAAVTVALVGALDRLTPGRHSPHEIAYIAQSIETDILHQQCGIQDQLCSAYGGINYIEMFQYPHASVSPIHISQTVAWELERRLSLIYLGRSHSSSQVHDAVIGHLEEAGPTGRQLEALRNTAEPSRDALYAGDLASLGQAMIKNTNAQRDLHPDLISPEARRVIEIAHAHGAWGWKVNGAGGKGGSLTILGGPDAHACRAMIREIEEECPLFQNIPIHFSPEGLRTWEVNQRAKLASTGF